MLPKIDSKSIKILAKLSRSTQDNASDLKCEIKTDISMALVKSKVQGLRAIRNGISSQVINFRTP